MEYINCGKAVYSRIARVCKKDTGGKNILSQNWATYLKARLNCSISGEFPFYFNEIQAVYQLPNDKTKFYATFATSTNGLVGSAVCSFDINEVHSAFSGNKIFLTQDKHSKPSITESICYNRKIQRTGNFEFSMVTSIEI